MGTSFTIIVVMYCMLIVFFEMVAYVILFKQLHTYNQELESKNLGLSKVSLSKRKRKNIISFVGEFATFIIEMIFGIVLQMVLVFNSANHFSGFIPMIGMLVHSALTIVFFMASPELKRFYFNF